MADQNITDPVVEDLDAEVDGLLIQMSEAFDTWRAESPGSKDTLANLLLLAGRAAHKVGLSKLDYSSGVQVEVRYNPWFMGGGSSQYVELEFTPVESTNSFTISSSEPDSLARFLRELARYIEVGQKTEDAINLTQLS